MKNKIFENIPSRRQEVVYFTPIENQGKTRRKRKKKEGKGERKEKNRFPFAKLCKEGGRELGEICFYFATLLTKFRNKQYIMDFINYGKKTEA